MSRDADAAAQKNRPTPPALLSWSAATVDEETLFDAYTPRSAPTVIQEEDGGVPHFAAIPPLYAPRNAPRPRAQGGAQGAHAGGSLTPIELELTTPPEPIVRSMAFGDYAETLKKRMLAQEALMAGGRRPDSVLPQNHSRHSFNATSPRSTEKPDAHPKTCESFFDSLPKNPPSYTLARREEPVSTKKEKEKEKETASDMGLFHAGHPLRALTLAILALMVVAAASACLVALIKLMATRTELSSAAIQEVVQRPYLCGNCFLPDQSTHSMCTECRNTKSTFPAVVAHARYKQIANTSYSVNVQPFLGDSLEAAFTAVVSFMFHATDVAALLAYLFVAVRIATYLVSAGPYAYVIARRDRIEMRALRSRYPAAASAGAAAPTRLAPELANGFKHE